MKPLIITFLLFAHSAFSFASGEVTNLAQLQWQHRLITINGGAETADYLTELGDNEELISDRDIIWIVVSPTGVSTNYNAVITASLADEIKRKQSDTPNKVVLTGKDGYVKKRSSTLELENILALIDTMPMRQIEMQGDTQR